MKKAILLTSLFAFMATAGFAQNEAKLTQVNKEMKSCKEFVDKSTLSVKPRRSRATGVYYDIQSGVWRAGMDKEGKSYSATFLVYPPFWSPYFYNRCGSNNVSWTINDKDATQYMEAETGDYDFGSLDKNCYNAETGSISYYYLPKISAGRETYSLYEVDNDGKANANSVGLVTVSSDGWDLSYTPTDYGVTGGFYARGIVDPASASDPDNESYIFGTGTVTLRDGSKYTSVGLAQVFPAPVSPFTCNEIDLKATSYSVPLAEGKSLTMEIRNVVTEDGEKTFGDEVYETLVCTSEDVSLAWEFSGGTKCYNINFHKKEVDDFGIETDVPFILDKEFAILILGVDGEGVDVGFIGASLNVDEADIEPTIPLISDDTSVGSFAYSIDLVTVCGFYGYQDACDVPTVLYGSDDTEFNYCNALRVSADGQTAVNNLYPEDFAEWIYIKIARDFVDENDMPNYSFLAPEWVNGISYSPLSSSDEDGMYVVTFTCDPLPEGVTGRMAEVYVVGSGVQSADPIVLLQGDATYDPAGVSTVTAQKASNSKVFTISGQLASKNYKGIVIKDGKKFMNK